ncbi:MAG TPA: hypothetical protein VF618_07395 [Thermoanaerobaculia bacterium]
MIGLALVLYFDTQKPPSEAKPRPPIASPTMTAQQPRIVEKQPDPQTPPAVVVAEPSPAIDAEGALKILQAKQTHQDVLRPEMLRYLQLSRKEIDAEVKAATSDVAAYTAEAVYAPERHTELYRKVNLLWDVPRLTDRENRWLAQSVAELNKLAIRHIEEAWKEGDGSTVIRTVSSFGEWAYRLDTEQEKRLATILQALAAGSRGRDDR